MKRNLDLIRELLLWLENNSEPLHKFDDFPPYSADVVERHLILMIEAGFVRGKIVGETVDGRLQLALVSAITYDGYEFLDLIREKDTVDEAIAKVKSTAGGVSFEVVKELVIAAIKLKMGME